METMKKNYENEIKKIKLEYHKNNENLKRDYDNKVQKLKAEYEKKLADKDALLKNSNSNMSQALDKMKAEYEKKITELNGEINKFRNNFLDKEKELNITKNRLYQYEGKVEDLTAKLKALEEKLSKTANLSEAEKNQILQEVHDLKEQLEAEINKNKELEQKIKTLESTIKERDLKITSLNMTIIDLKKEIEGLQKSGDSEMKNKNDMINKLKEEELNKKINDLISEYE